MIANVTTKKVEFREIVEIEYQGYGISYHDWRTTELCIVHTPGKDDYYFDGTALECFQWIDNRISYLQED